ncbi:DUF1566 domain-containing protein [Leptospira sp. 201903070]|uniref:DUF1566 domain-containing protein n=1 Tax=Leptospira ainlahdjerensis TaxID=2810033 RepID=A0ABS2U5Z9_9LEPT|nr:DUF1566 domain-containing protein [Leptospira ainlahdjerensis]MBM9575800.1 DUF1566 domain-containing protein [Leptospira ainlahdjerensis]
MYKFLLSTIFTIVLFACVRPPEKPDPPFAILQYLTKLNSSNTANEEENLNPSSSSPILCPALAFVFNPGGIVDTGQTTCWNTLGVPIACLGTGLDGAFANVPNARSFVGPTQHCVYPNDYTTLDSFHGLTWKSCAEGQSGPTCGIGGPTQLTWNAATTIPAPMGSCGALNTQNGGNGYAGRTDWRLPTLKELASLLHYSNAPQIDLTSFPNTFTGFNYMTNSPESGNAANIWAVSFNNVIASKIDIVTKATPINIRCVSGNPIPAQAFLDNGDGTISDLNTGLIWQKCTDGQAAITCAGIPVDNDLNAALASCNALNVANFGGRNDWRLPNTNELLSIVDYSTLNPSISGFYPNTSQADYWTSTTYSNMTSRGIIISFLNGALGINDKASLIRSRCVAN